MSFSLKEGSLIAVLVDKHAYPPLAVRSPQWVSAPTAQVGEGPGLRVGHLQPRCSDMGRPADACAWEGRAQGLCRSL